MDAHRQRHRDQRDPDGRTTPPRREASALARRAARASASACTSRSPAARRCCRPSGCPSLVDAAGPPARQAGRAGPRAARRGPGRGARPARALPRDREGASPTHFDSHHHSHRTPAVLEALRHAGLGDGPARAQRLARTCSERLRRENIPTTDAFVEDFYDQHGPAGDAARASWTGSRPGTTELMCHPARRRRRAAAEQRLRRHARARAGAAHAPRGAPGGAGAGHQAHPLRRADGVDRGSFRERAPVRSRPTARARPSACRT